MHRRTFFLGATALGATLNGRSDTIRVACVGLRGRGGDHLKAWGSEPRAEIAAICDIDERLIRKRFGELESAGVRKPAVFTDFRKLLEDKTIDAVSIATPNHHHTLQTIWACQAGKDVYVEKPCSHTMFESKQIVAAARRYNRIVQHGTQSRSIPVYQEAVRLMREGLLGDIYLARSLCYKWRAGIGKAAVEPVPPGVHYDLWVGPAPMKPFTRNRFHYNWHWQWDYGNGEIGNQGIHQIDAARWGLGVDLPVRISAMGGHYMFDDDQQTPNVMIATYNFDDNGRKKTLVCECRNWITNDDAGVNIGNVFYGCRGYLTLDEHDTGYKSWLGKERTPGPAKLQAETGINGLLYRAERHFGWATSHGGDHFGNFLDAVGSRRREDLNAEIAVGATSCMLVHLANISYRLGRTIDFDPVTRTCQDPEAQAMFTTPYRAPFVVPENV